MVSAIDTLAAFSRITDGRTTETRNAESFNPQNTTCLCETGRNYIFLELRHICVRVLMPPWITGSGDFRQSAHRAIASEHLFIARKNWEER